MASFLWHLLALGKIGKNGKMAANVECQICWSIQRREEKEEEEEEVIYRAYTNTNTITCGYGYEHTHYELWNIHKKCLCKQRLHLVTFLLLSSTSLLRLPISLTSIVVIEFRCMRFAIFPTGFGLLFSRRLHF